MNSIVIFLNAVAAWLWGPPLLILLVGGGLFLTVKLGFFQFKYLPFIMKKTFGKMFSKGSGKGSVSPFQAMSVALASSIGAANIVVVPSIIFFAGPGAVFWMWIAAILGQATKFSEVILGIKYRETNADGDYIGGPAYYLKNGVTGYLGKVLGFCVAFFFMIEILPSITLQTISAVSALEKLAESISVIDIKVMQYISIGVILILVVLVVYGGVKRIGKVTEFLVPLMATIYAIFACIIIIMHIDKVPEAFRLIFVGAFNPVAIAGGGVGSVLIIIQKGIARGVYSNEAGMGSAPYGHSAAMVNHPCEQGIWGVFEVFIDTIIVCTLSALVVLTTGIWKQPDFAGIAVERAFNLTFGTFGSVIISLSLFLFVLSTILVIVFYCEKQGEYLFGTKVGKIMRLVATGMIPLAAFVNFRDVGFVLDITLALVVIPNMIGLIVLRNEVKDLKTEFFDRGMYKKLK